MSSHNVETLRRAYDLMWRDGKIDEALQYTDPDIEWVTPRAPDGEVRHGRAAVGRFFRDWLDVFEPIEVSYEFTDVDADRVVVSSLFRGVSRDSGIETEIELGQIWTMRDGLAVRCEHFETAAQALAAAGGA